MMPVGQRTFEFPELPYRSFHGLPGLLSDSVPDKFGNAVINVWLKSQGRMPDSLTPVERLCYTGTLDKDRTCDHVEAKIVFGLAQPGDPNARTLTYKDDQGQDQTLTFHLEVVSAQSEVTLAFKPF